MRKSDIIQNEEVNESLAGTDEVVYIFNPETLDDFNNYRKAYPDLLKIPEFADLRDIDLVFIWFFSNPTSYMVYQYPDRYDRAKKAFNRVYINAKDEVREMIVTCTWADTWRIAIERMSLINPDTRYKAAKMVEQIWKDVENILSKPLENFKNSKGTVDYNGYWSIRRTIMGQLSKMIEEVETRFGVTTSMEQRNKEIIKRSYIEDYIKNKKAN